MLQNLQPKQGVCNGTRGIVTQMTRQVLKVCLFNGNYVLIPQIKLIYINRELPYHLHCWQFPILLTFDMTINKAQGQSFHTVGIDLQKPTFTHGQLYVALSQGQSAPSIKCIINPRNTLHWTTNIIFREVIL